MNKKLHYFAYGLGGLIVGITLAYTTIYYRIHSPLEDKEIIVGQYEVCFTPPSGCLSKIISKINESQKSIYIQAYSFTAKEVKNALIQAWKRGVKIEIIVDRGQKKAKGSIIHDLAIEKIPIYLDCVSGLAHNKVMIIDERIVITGSFNFTKAANTRNAENLLVIQDRKLASIYKQNWDQRLLKAKKYILN